MKKLAGKESILETKILELESLVKRLNEKLLLKSERYNMVMSCADLDVFEYNVKTKKMIGKFLDFAMYGLPVEVEDAVETFIRKGIIKESSVPSFRELYRKIENGASEATAILSTVDAKGREIVVEVRLKNIFGIDGELLQTIGVKKDLTENQWLQREKEYGSILASNKNMSYDANVTQDKIITSDDEWKYCIGDNLDCKDSFSQSIEYVAQHLVLPEDRSLFLLNSSASKIQEAYECDEKHITFEYRKRTLDGKYQWFEKTLNIIKDDITGDINVRCYVSNIHEQKEKALKALAEQKYYESMRAKSMLVYELNLTQNSINVEYKGGKIPFGILQTSNYSEMIQDLTQKEIHPEDREQFLTTFLRENLLATYGAGEEDIEYDYRRLNKSAEFMWFCCRVHLFQDPNSRDICGVAYVESIHEEKQKELELVYKSQHDMLTGFYNKNTVEEKIEAFFNTMDAKIATHAFFILDLDFFKIINDNFGHAFGDVTLSRIASKIKLLFREDDFLGRIGGDEFVILMKNIQDAKVAMTKAEEICRICKEEYTQNGKKFQISLSIGIALYGEHGRCYEELYAHSDTALYLSKENGRNKCFMFAEGMKNNNAGISKAMDNKGIVEKRKFDDNILEYVFKILYESSDKEAAIFSVLALMGKYYNVSRTYVFEDSQDGTCTNNTFEWCKENVIPQMGQLQNIQYVDLGEYKENFNKDGIFYMPDINDESEEVKAILAPQNVKTMLQCSIVHNGKFVGFVGLDQCEFIRIPTTKEISDMKNISNVLGVFILEMRALKENNESKNAALSIVNGLDAYAYVCDSESYEVLFINDKTMMLVPDAKVGDYCYEAFWNREAPCENCPMKELKANETQKKYTMDLLNPNLNVWVKATASWIKWLGGRKACLVDSVDITQYKEQIKAMREGNQRYGNE